MGYYGSTRIIYGFLLDAEDIVKISEEVDEDSEEPEYDWAQKNGLAFDQGGSFEWSEEEQDSVVGVEIGKWISEFGAYQLDDNWGIVPEELIEEMKVWEDYFNRPARRFLVSSFG